MWMRFKKSEIFFSWTYPFWFDFFLSALTAAGMSYAEWRDGKTTTTRRTKREKKYNIETTTNPIECI